jgi:ATP-dependent exoDNAse (exonuclease V) beta subunit
VAKKNIKNMAFQVYNASAGSGKTYTLTKEYLKILLVAPANDTYKKILAITFTNKAVEEMKSRIIESLIAFTKDEVTEKTADFMREIAAEIKLDVPSIQQKSRKILKNLIHNYAAFDISTIDKFTHRIIRTFTHDLNLPTNFDVTLDTDELLKNAIDVVVAKAGEDEELTQILINFAKSKTDDDKSWDVTLDLYEVSRLILNEEHFFNFGKLSDKSVDDFSKIAEKIKLKIESNKLKIKENAKFILDDFAANNLTEEDFDRKTFYNHVANLFNEKATEYDFVNEKEIGVPKKSNNSEVVRSLAPTWKEKLTLIYKAKTENALFDLIIKNMIPLSLINVIYKEYKQLQEDQNVLSISDFNAIIHNEIKDQPAPFIYERLGDRYRHYFIDEFQDTSQLQWENFIPLIDNALASEDLDGTKGSLMIVGDPKQSIYRWRGGKAEQFIDLSTDANPFSNKLKVVENLPKNYRSYSEVIDFNNQFFQFLSEEFTNEAYQKLYKETAGQETNEKKGGFVSVAFLDDTIEINEEIAEDESITEKDKQYLSKTLEIIQQSLANGFDYSDIVLLTRKTKNGVLLANFLTENNIPIISSETLLIQNASEVKFIINFLEYLDSSNNQESKINWLYFVANTKVDKDKIHDFIVSAKDLSEADLQKYLASFNCEISFENCRKKSLYEAVENIVNVFLKEKTTISYVQYFLDLVLERNVKYQTSIADFLEYWEKSGFKQSIPSPEGEKAIRIMTIHKSKGLEFPVVIYPFADDSLNPRSNNIWIPMEDESVDMPQALVKNNKILEKYSDTTQEIYQTKSQEEILDTINVLYVALTRAEEQLHIISSYKITTKGEISTSKTLASYFINFLLQKANFSIEQKEYAFGNPKRHSQPKLFTKNKAEIQSVIKALDFSSIRIAKKEALMWGTLQQDAIEFGNIIHQILSYITSKNDLQTALTKSLDEGLIQQSQKSIFEEKINQIIHHPELEAFFNPNYNVFTEHNIISPNEINLKPDRLVIHNSEAFLIDYKTGAQDEKHKKQIENYVRVIEKMNLKVTKKVLLYIGEELKIIHL